MRAIRVRAYGGPEVMSLDEVALPELRRRDLLVAVHASSVNPVDISVRKGEDRATIRLRLPGVIGMDLSGVVVRVGADVRGFRVGDAVVASPTHHRMGTYAELAVVDEREAARKPATLSHVEAASLPLVCLTAWDALVRHGRLAAGQRVLIQAGSGGVGTAAIQVARHLGAEVLTTCSAKNADFVQELGATRAIDYHSESYEEVAADCDCVLDTLGDEHLERALATVRRGGRIVTIAPGQPRAVERYGPYLGQLVLGVRLLGLFVRAWWRKRVAFRIAVRPPDGALLQQLMDLVEAGAIRPVIDTVLPLEEAAEAHRLIERGGRRGKVVLEVRR